MTYARTRRAAWWLRYVWTSPVPAIFVAVCMALLPSVASADPGHPGVPDDPKVVFVERFENVQNPPDPGPPVVAGQHELLNAYTGPAPLAMTYFAQGIWIDLGQCNGVILSANTPVPGGSCGATPWSELQVLAQALGNFEPPASGAAFNHVLAQWTSSNPVPTTPDPTIRTEKDIPLEAQHRFLTGSIDIGVTSCDVAHPALRFFLIDAGTDIPVETGAVDPCTDPRGTALNAEMRYGRFAANSAALINAANVRFKVTNNQGDFTGNDYAVDNLRLLDGTPQLDKAFKPNRTSVGGITRLTFTITNTSELAGKPGWSFTDKLPKTLRVAKQANVATDCPNAAVNARKRNIRVQGDLNAGMVSCQVSLDVKVLKPGKHTNGRANIAKHRGIELPGQAAVRALPAKLTIAKAVDRARAYPGEKLNYTITVRNKGKGDAKKVRVCDQLPNGLKFVKAPGAKKRSASKACWRVATIAAGKSVKFRVTARITGVFSGRLVNTATVNGAAANAAAATAAVTVVNPGCRC